MIKKLGKVLIRGGGELASGVGWALAKAGYQVVLTEVPRPLMVRWPVSFGTAVIEKIWEVEGVRCRLIDSPEAIAETLSLGEIPLLIDPALNYLSQIKPDVLVDAIMAKRNLGTCISMAPLTIGLGPGFEAPKDVHLVIETNRGHQLGRLIHQGIAESNTGVPGEIGGFTSERVVYSPVAGIFRPLKKIGDWVKAREVLGEIENCTGITQVTAAISGILRGLLQTGTIDANVKIGDIDPRAQKNYCWTISDKARCIGTSVLLGILSWDR